MLGSARLIRMSSRLNRAGCHRGLIVRMGPWLTGRYLPCSVTSKRQKQVSDKLGRIHSTCLANSISCPVVLSLGLVYKTLILLAFDPLCVGHTRGFLCSVLGNLPLQV